QRAILVVLAMAAPCLSAEGAKIRVAAAAGAALQNQIVGAGGFSGGAGLHVAYPVSPPYKPVNVEIAIVNWYNAFPGGEAVHLFRLGFGIRVFLNTLGTVRPYFTHDICSHLVWQEGREGHAAALGILLGLGIDVPLRSWVDGRLEGPLSLFSDVSYSSFELVHFAEPRLAVRFVVLTCGISWHPAR
ncbi:MAG: hypothetical protein JW820_09890, partial [Spirochaetales bacterium]|nr:hypothetical protein [Spirochaetales bacterium]